MSDLGVSSRNEARRKGGPGKSWPSSPGTCLFKLGGILGSAQSCGINMSGFPGHELYSKNFREKPLLLNEKNKNKKPYPQGYIE